MLPPEEQPLVWEDPDHDPYDDPVTWGESVNRTSNALGDAMVHLAGIVNKVTDARQEPPSEEELRGWLAVPPIDWPGTPSLAVWHALDSADDQLRYEVPEGHLRNLLDEAMEVLEGLGVVGGEGAEGG